MKKVSRLVSICFVGMLLFCLSSCTTGIPTTPSGAETKLTEKGYDVEAHTGNDAIIGALFIFGDLYRDMPKSLEDIIMKNAIDVVIGGMENTTDNKNIAICAIWFKTSDTAREVFEPFHTYLEENAKDESKEERLKDIIIKQYENIIYIGTEKGIQDFEN